MTSVNASSCTRELAARRSAEPVLRPTAAKTEASTPTKRFPMRQTIITSDERLRQMKNTRIPCNTNDRLKTRRAHRQENDFMSANSYAQPVCFAPIFRSTCSVVALAASARRRTSEVPATASATGETEHSETSGISQIDFLCFSPGETPLVLRLHMLRCRRFAFCAKFSVLAKLSWASSSAKILMVSLTAAILRNEQNHNNSATITLAG